MLAGRRSASASQPAVLAAQALLLFLHEMRTRCLIVNELTDARMPAVWPSMSGTASVPDMFAGITLRPGPNSTGVPIATGISVMVSSV